MLNLHRDNLDDDQYMPFEQGWDAFIEHKRESRNPWAINNWKHYDWQEGWTAARKKTLEDNDKPTH